MPSTSTRPSSNIPLETLPFLNTRHTSNDDIITNQPSIGRRTPTGDDNDDDEGDDEADEEPNGDVDEEVGLNQQPRRRQHRRRRRHAPSITTPTTTNIEPEWRLHLYNLLERPNSSAAAVLVHVLVTGLIAFSALVTILETVPAFHSLPGGIWFGLETSLVALFTVEYVARCAATSYSWSALFAWVGCACVSVCSFLCFQGPFEMVNMGPDCSSSTSKRQPSLVSWTFWPSFLTT